MEKDKNIYLSKDITAKFKKYLSASRKRIYISLIILLLAGFIGWKTLSSQTPQPQYQTAQAEKGTLVTFVSVSGLITAGNNLPITTAATGTVSQVFVSNGDTVVKGQKIADIILDQDSQQKQASAWSSYLQAQNSLNSAQAKINSLQSALFVANQKFVTDRGVINPSDQQKADPVYIEENTTWLQAEADYKNQAGVISQAQASLNNSWLSYQQIIPTIVSPADGTISNLTIATGSIISPQTTSSSSNSSGNSLQKLGVISMPQSNIQSLVNLSEMDVINVKPGQKVTLTLDALPEKTFTGKVLIVNTNGSVSSGVTTYPATIVFDTSAANIYPNMAVSAKIITNIENDVVLVPSSAVQTQPSSNGFTIRVLKNGQTTSVPVEVGNSNDTQIKIVSGINEGDTVVTAIINPVTTGGQSGAASSPFGGSFGGGRGGFGSGGGGGGAARTVTGR